MDPAITSLETKVMTILLPFVTKGAEEFMKTAGKDAYEKAKSLLGKLKAKCAVDKEATDQLANFEKKPECYQLVLEDFLARKLAEDGHFADELTRILKKTGPSLEIFQKTKESEDVTGLKAKEMTGGSVKVEQDIKKVKNVTGAVIDHVG